MTAVKLIRSTFVGRHRRDCAVAKGCSDGVILAVLDMRINHPWHKFRKTFDICDEIEQLWRGIFQMLALPVGRHDRSTAADMRLASSSPSFISTR